MMNENRYILELCKFKNADKDLLVELMKSELDYPYILGHLLYNRVGGIAYYTLMKYELLQNANREFRNTLKLIYQRNAEKGYSLTKAIDGMKFLCAQLSFPYALLKGAYLVDLYPVGLRTSNDVDFLIHPKNISELSNILKSAGFQQGYVQNDRFVMANRAEIVSSRLNRGETVPFIKEINYSQMQYLEIDVNFSLGFKPGKDEEIVTKLLSNTKPLMRNDLYTLSKTDFLFHLCAHLYKEATVMKWVEMGRDISLYKYCDIYLFIHDFMDADFTEELKERVSSIGLHKEVYYALYYTRLLFGIENQHLDALLTSITPKKRDFMNLIIDPQTNKKYRFDEEYTNWVFCSNRRRKLHET